MLVRRRTIKYADYIKHYDIDAYDNLATEDMSHSFRHSERRRIQLIAKMVPDTGVRTVLDIGCGNGELSELLARRGMRVISTDIGFDNIRRASAIVNSRLDSGRTGSPVRFIQGDVYRLPYKNGSFDAVIASEIIEHLEYPPDAFSEAARVLRPGGFFVVSTPYMEKIPYTLCIHCNKKTPVNAHLHSFDEGVLSGLFSDAGFTAEKCVIFSSKYAAAVGFPGLSYFLPYAFWRTIDRMLCSLLGKQTHIVIRAQRSA